MDRQVYIKGGLRTPIGVVHGQYKEILPEVLGSRILNQLRHTYRLESVDSVICGNATGTGGNIGRLMTLMSRFPDTVPAMTVDTQCASGGMSVAWAYAQIKAGISHTVIAGGIESASLQPKRSYAALDRREGDYYVAQFSPHEISSDAMLWGAERTIKKHAVSDEEMKYHVLRSHRLAQEAKEKRVLEPYVLPVIVHQRYCIDECIRKTMSASLLNRMKPILGEGTQVTAGNACLTHDGAAFLVVTDTPSECRIAHIESWAGNPLYSPEGAWLSTELLLNRTQLSMDDIDVIEWNEAFAVIDVLFARTYPNQLDTYNRLGGALAYGHPYGASGTIILLHAMAALQACQGKYAICAIAGAGGTGVAILLERMEQISIL